MTFSYLINSNILNADVYLMDIVSISFKQDSVTCTEAT